MSTWPAGKAAVIDRGAIAHRAVLPHLGQRQLLHRPDPPPPDRQGGAVFQQEGIGVAIDIYLDRFPNTMKLQNHSDHS